MPAEYKLLPEGKILRDADKAVIPNDPSNKDFKAYQDWAGSNTPDAQTVTDLDFAKQRATERVEAKAARAYADALGTRAEQMDFAALLQEANGHYAQNISGSATPMLLARITGSLTSETKVAQQAHIDMAAKNALAQTAHEARVADLALITAATTVAEADAIAAG